MVNQLVNRLKEQEIELQLTEGAIALLLIKGLIVNMVLVHYVEQFRSM